MALGRDLAGYVLFEIAFKNEDQATKIKNELEKLRAGPQPHWRIAANKTLEMIAIGDLVNEAHTYPQKIEQIKSRLEVLSFSGEDHLEYAAEKSLTEIEKFELEIEQ